MLGDVLGSIGGSIVSGLFSAREANKNRDLQVYMANTARQREVADLKAAGLNPVLAAGGSGAPVAPGSMATIPDLGASVTNARQQAKQRDLIDQQIALTRAQTARTKVDTTAAKGTKEFVLGLGVEKLGSARSSSGSIPSEITRRRLGDRPH